MESTRVAEAPRASGVSSWLTVLVGVCVAAVALAFALNATDAHSHVFAVFKLIHVSVAVFWVGSGLLLTVLAMRAERAGDPDELATIARQAAFAGRSSSRQPASSCSRWESRW